MPETELRRRSPKIERYIPFGPPGGAAVNLTLHSYSGRAELGINADTAAVPDGGVFSTCIQDGIDEVLAVG